MKRNLERAVALFWLALSACACLLTSWAARALGAGWRLQNAAGMVVGLGWLIIFGLFGWGGEGDGERKV